MGYLRTMGRTVGIDFGERRIGIASTDVLGIAVHPRGTFTADTAIEYLKELLATDEVHEIVIGLPSKPSGSFKKSLLAFIERIEALDHCPEIVLHDEDYTSQEAASIMHQMGQGRKVRKEKGRLDQISAVLLLQDYLGHR